MVTQGEELASKQTTSLPPLRHFLELSKETGHI